MWDDPNDLVVAATGEVYVAPVGTALPTKESDALNAAFVGLGYTDEEGVTINVNPDFAEFRAWQSRTPVRREFTHQAATVAFKLLQWNDDTLKLAFNGGKVTALGGGSYRYDLPSGADGVDERALIVDLHDGSETWRFVFPRGNATEAVPAGFHRTGPALLPITFAALAHADDPDGPPGYVLTNSAAMAVGS